jgi:hypothetical protein
MTGSARMSTRPRAQIGVPEDVRAALSERTPAPQPLAVGIG